MPRRFLLLLALMAGCVVLQPALAETTVSQRAIVSSKAFLKHHPDLRYRFLGLREYDRGDHQRAMDRFLIAARWADKPSQAMIAQMYYLGRGVLRDPVQAYIWMDLAAERGSARMVMERERYWVQLDASQRARVLELGPEVYARYGDEAAGPRLARVLERGRRAMTGGRLGMSSQLDVVLPTTAGSVIVRGEEFYQDSYWDLPSYWAWQERAWDAVPNWRIETDAAAR
jgi:hypothetical protein